MKCHLGSSRLNLDLCILTETLRLMQSGEVDKDDLISAIATLAEGVSDFPEGSACMISCIFLLKARPLFGSRHRSNE